MGTKNRKTAAGGPTPRSTRLIRVPDLQTFQRAVVELSTLGPPLDARDRIVVVPTQAAASLLIRNLEERLAASPVAAVILPDFVTARELVSRLGERLDDSRPLLTSAEREVLLGLACRMVRDDGNAPPFQLRPGLVAEILRLYDELRRRQNSVDDFERRTLGVLEPGAASDRGAARLVTQTRFLVAAFREFERQAMAYGEDEHLRRSRLISEPATRPYRHLVLTVADESFDPYGVAPADWDLLTRIPGLQRLDVVVTDAMLAGALHERMHQVLPGVEEERYQAARDAPVPVLVAPPGDGVAYVARDREDEVAMLARRIKDEVRRGVLASPGRAALVVRQRLPYAYVAREVFRSAGVPCQMLDMLPLAAEPFAAALDLVLSCASADFARVPSIALLRSPHFRLSTAADAAALDRGLAEAGYLGGREALERIVTTWRDTNPLRGEKVRAIRAGEQLIDVARELAPLQSSAPTSEHLRLLIAFLLKHDFIVVSDEAVLARHLRARSAILTTLVGLRDAYAKFDDVRPVSADEVAALVRRWIEGQTFAPRAGDSGVHLVDADSARFGRFDEVHIAGMVEDEWPDRVRRNIFYSPGILRELGWPAEVDRLTGVRAAFVDLLRLPALRLSVSMFALEADALVSASPLLDEVEQCGLERCEEVVAQRRIFHDEALYIEPIEPSLLDAGARTWLDHRLNASAMPLARFRGITAPLPLRPFSLSALERYQDCPFKFFAAEVLRLEEAADDESSLSPRARGRFVHEVFQRFFEAWDSRKGGAITTERLNDARTLMAEVAEPLLARLSPADAALERARLFGSAISAGSVDIVLGHEAAAPSAVRERWLEHRLEGEFTLGAPDSRRVSLRGVADRIDLLADGRLRVIDYKSGSAPNPSRALQVAIYALCARELLRERDGGTWPVAEAAYLAFTGKRSLVPVVRPDDSDAEETLESARQRLFGIVDRVARGEFPPQPQDPIICDFCTYAAVCRKDYVQSD